MSKFKSDVSEIAAARRDVERAKLDLAHQLRIASKTGSRMIQRTVSRTVETARPLLVATAWLGAAALLVGIIKLSRQRSRRQSGWLLLAPAPRSTTLLGTLFRSALKSAATSLLAHLMNRVARHVEGLPRTERPRLSPGPTNSASLDHSTI